MMTARAFSAALLLFCSISLVCRTTAAVLQLPRLELALQADMECAPGCAACLSPRAEDCLQCSEGWSLVPSLGVCKQCSSGCPIDQCSEEGCDGTCSPGTYFGIVSAKPRWADCIDCPESCKQCDTVGSPLNVLCFECSEGLKVSKYGDCIPEDEVEEEDDDKSETTAVAALEDDLATPRRILLDGAHSPAGMPARRRLHDGAHAPTGMPGRRRLHAGAQVPTGMPVRRRLHEGAQPPTGLIGRRRLQEGAHAPMAGMTMRRRASLLEMAAPKAAPAGRRLKEDEDAVLPLDGFFDEE